METTKRSPLDRLLFATFLKGRTSSREILNRGRWQSVILTVCQNQRVKMAL